MATAIARARRSLQRAPDTAPPADLDPGFNPQDIAHRLVEAIDQTQLKSLNPPLVRHVDLPAVVAALDRRTVNQIQQIDTAYRAFEKRSLRADLLGGGDSGFPADLTQDGFARVRAMLEGTAAAPGDTDLAVDLARLNRLDADAAELHALLRGDLGSGEVERVMILLRRAPAENLEVAKRYRVLAGVELTGDLGRLGARNAPRAQLLFFGQAAAADAVKAAELRGRVARIDTSITELKSRRGDFAVVVDFKVAELRKQRRAAIAELEALVGQSGAEARRESLEQADLVDPAAAQATADQAAKARMSTVLGGDTALASAGIAGADAAALRALVSDDPVGRAAAHLQQLHEAGKLDAAALTETLRTLREQAETAARRAFMLDGPEAQTEAANTLATDFIRRLPATYDTTRPSGAPSFEQLASKGTVTDIALNAALRLHGGELDPVQELRFALAGDRKDLTTVKRVLRTMSAAEIADIKRQYPELETQLFGLAPTTAGVDNEAATIRAVLAGKSGKATGTDRIELEDYLQRPSVEGGPEEARYVLARAEREYQYAIDNRGFTGWWRDHWGNEARALMDSSIANIRLLHNAFIAGGGTDTEALRQMRLWRATIRGDRAGYEKANAELRATFEAVAAFALQVALTALLTPAAAALLRVAEGAEAALMAARAVKVVRGVLVNTITTVAANAAVHDDYGLAGLQHDLLGSLGSFVGAGTVNKLSGLLGPRFVSSLAGKELISAASTLAGIEATAAIEGRSLTADLSVRNFLLTHGQGKVMHAVGEAVTPKEGAAGRGRTGRTGVAEPVPERSQPPESLGSGATESIPSMRLPEPSASGRRGTVSGPLRMSERELTAFAAEVLRRPVRPMQGEATFYDDVASYEAEFRRRFPGLKPPGGGYFDPNVGDIHVSPRANLNTVLHEAIHKIAEETSPLAKQLMGRYLNEGITEQITRDRLGPRASDHGYDRNVAYVRLLQERLGVAVVENAILHGDWRSFREAVRARVGSDAALAEFVRLIGTVDSTAHDSPALAEALALLDGGRQPGPAGQTGGQTGGQTPGQAGRGGPVRVDDSQSARGRSGAREPEAALGVKPGEKTEIERAVDARLTEVENTLNRDTKLRSRFQAEVKALRTQFERLRAIYRDQSPDLPNKSTGMASLGAYEELMALRDQAADVLVRLKAPAGAGAISKKTFDSAGFARAIAKMPDGIRIPYVERVAAAIAAEDGFEYDAAASSRNNRSVYRHPRTGEYRSVDTRHGAFHHLTERGVDLGKYNFTDKQLVAADNTGGHDLKL